MILPVDKPADNAPLQATLDRAPLGGKRGVAVYFDEPSGAFGDAVDRFRARLAADPAKARLVYERAHKVPVFPLASRHRPKGP